jgi:hypothetical protein
MLKSFARTMVCISLVVAAAPSFAGKIIDENFGALHAQENFGGGGLTVSVGNFSSNKTYHNVFFQYERCVDITLQICPFVSQWIFMGNAIDPGNTDRQTVPAPPGWFYGTQISADGGGEFIGFPGYFVGR